jgi:hypothetical protein
MMTVVDAAFLRNKISGLVRDDTLVSAGLNSPSLAKEGVLVDIWTYYLSHDGVESEYPFPAIEDIPSNSRLAEVFRTGKVYVCDFTPDYDAFPGFPGPEDRQTYANAVMEDVWTTFDDHYGTTTELIWVYSLPSEGSTAHFTNLKNGRFNEGCDVDAAPAAFGGYYLHGPRTTGPNGQFVVSVPIQGAHFSFVVRDDSGYTTFDDVIADNQADDGTELTICYARRNAGMSETFFRNENRNPVDYNIQELCEEAVLAYETGRTIFLSEFESTSTTPKKEGLTVIDTASTVPIGFYAVEDPGAGEDCVLCNNAGDVIGDADDTAQHRQRHLLMGVVPSCCEATYA